MATNPDATRSRRLALALLALAVLAVVAAVAVPTWLLHRPQRTVLNPLWKWAVWYPLRRSGKFAQLAADEQRVILAEHGAIGMSFPALVPAVPAAGSPGAIVVAGMVMLLTKLGVL